MLLAASFVVQAAPAAAQSAHDAASEAYRLYAGEDFEGAVAAARLAVERAPDSLDYRLLLADALARSGRQAEVLSVLDPADLSHDVQSRRAEALFATRDWLNAAEAFANAAATAPDPVRRSYQLRAQALSLVYADKTADAALLVRQSVADARLDAEGSVDWAMVAIAAGEDGAAQRILADETLWPRLSRQSALDAAYSAKRAKLDERALRFFEQGLRLDEQSSQPMTEEQRLAIRREIANLDRRVMVSGQVSYGETDRAASFLNLPGITDGSIQAGAEIAYRLGGWRNGRPIMPFMRAFATTYTADQVGARDAVQGWVGVQHKPLSDLNMIVEASRLFAIDGPALNDWALRTALSAGTGIEPEASRSNWQFWDVYADASYLFDAKAASGVVNARYGRAFSVPRSPNPLVITPFAVTQLGYDSLQAEEFALGAGAGVSVRRWLGGSRLRAPLAYIDLSGQARQRVAGDDRATGIHATVSFGF